MTADEAKALANAFLTEQHGKPCAVFDWSARETPTHWRFYWNTVASIEGREPALKGVDPVAVDKRTGVVAFPVPPKGGPVADDAEAAAVLRAWLDATQERPCFVKPYRELSVGWVFTWNTEASLQDPLAGYDGQGPTLVVRKTGEIFDVGSAPGYDERLEELARKLGAR